MDRIISSVNAFRLDGLFSWRMPRLADIDGRNCNVVDIFFGGPKKMSCAGAAGRYAQLVVSSCWMILAGFLEAELVLSDRFCSR